MRAAITMGSPDSHVSTVGVLLRLRGLVARWAASIPSRRHVGTDGLTDDERAEYAARFWTAAKTPPSEETRLRIRHEVQAGTRPVVHLKRSR
jgi:hypothetical protein